MWVSWGRATSPLYLNKDRCWKMIEKAIPSHVNQRMKRTRRRENLSGYLFISPWIIGFILLMLGPMVFSLAISFFKWNMLGTPSFIGLDNYKRMFTTDPFYYKALGVTLTYVFITVPLQVIFAIVTAMLLNRITKGVKLLRAVFYLPSLVQGVALALIWTWLYNNDFGLINYFLSSLGLPKVEWLTNPHTALPALIIMAVWGIGSPMVLYLSAIKSVNSEYYEAASLDGAGSFRQFVNITLPMITPTILFNIITSLIASFQTVVQAYVMTGGGPAHSTYFYSLHVYESAFVHFEMGYSSAMAWVMFIVILAATGIIMKSSQYWVYYEADGSGK
jgi:multiple sugar transport system permease protein